MGTGNRQLQHDITGIVRCIEKRKCIACKNHSFETCSINGAKTAYNHTCASFNPHPNQVRIVREWRESCEP